ncbi:MAG TPA: cupin domain-containing protein [Blastocatellia bacterium]|nr:cupin domain-containing protein [Blastocatellia bacterium]
MMILAQGCRVIPPGNGEEMTEGTRRYRMPVSRRQGARDIAQTVSRYGRGLSPARRNGAAEEVLYVFSGSGTCYINGRAYEVRSGTAVFIPPGHQYQIENPGDELLETVSVCCPEETSVEIHPGPIERIVQPTNEIPKLTVQESEREAIPTGERSFRLLAHKDLGCRRVTQFLGVIPPSRAPHHYHTYEEAIFILQGRGIVWADDESCEFTAGTSIYLPPGQRHCLENPGPDEVRLLGVFYPSGSPAVSYSDSE